MIWNLLKSTSCPMYWEFWTDNGLEWSLEDFYLWEIIKYLIDLNMGGYNLKKNI